MAKALLEEQNPFGALRYFDEAIANGVRVSDIAADRGLAYDLIGRNQEAQRDYELAMRSDRSDELLTRYAISLGISGDFEAADAKLRPLLQKSDRDAWRHRAFIMAMNGKGKDANDIAKQTMQRKMARAIKPFFDRMPKLTAAQKAAAVHYGHFPASENIGVDVASVQYASSVAARGVDGADAGLIPLGEPLGKQGKKPRVLAMPNTSSRSRSGNSRNLNRKRAGKDTVEVVVLNRDTMPVPTERRALSRSERDSKETRRVAADSPEGKRILRRAAREGSTEAKTYLANQNKDPVTSGQSTPAETPVPSPALTQRAEVQTPSPAPTPTQPPVRSSSNEAVAPGFETPVLDRQRSRAKPVEIARADIPKPDLVSTSVERKVAIGNVPPPTSLLSEAITRQTAPDANEPGSANLSSTNDSVENNPAQPASFDLANTVRSPAGAPPGSASNAAAVKPLADIIGAISIPDAEKRSEIVPVDLGSITPATAEAEKEPEPAATKVAEKEPEPDHPKRYWVQIATGSNISALKYDFRKMKKKNAAMFGDMEGWTSPWGQTRRMVIGPFEDLSSAKKFDSEFRKNGGDSFAWVSKQGTEVNKLP